MTTQTTVPGFIHRALRHRSFMIGLIFTGTMIFLALQVAPSMFHFP